MPRFQMPKIEIGHPNITVPSVRDLSGDVRRVQAAADNVAGNFSAPTAARLMQLSNEGRRARGEDPSTSFDLSALTDYDIAGVAADATPVERWALADLLAARGNEGLAAAVRGYTSPMI